MGRQDQIKEMNLVLLRGGKTSPGLATRDGSGGLSFRRRPSRPQVGEQKELGAATANDRSNLLNYSRNHRREEEEKTQP